MSDDCIEENGDRKPCEGFYGNCVDFACEDFPCIDLSTALKQFSQNNTTEDQYTNSSLGKWLKLETWTIREALLLMCGFSPDGADIAWSEPMKMGGCDYFDRIKIKKAQVLSSNVWLECESVKCDSSLDPKSVKSINSDIDVLRYSELLMNYLLKLWREDSYQRKKTRSSVRTYIWWAERINAPIRWLDWARTNGLLLEHESRHGLWSKDGFEDIDMGQKIKDRENRKLQRNSKKRKIIDSLSISDDEKQIFQYIPYQIYLSSYFDLDSWSVKEGLLILAGIAPASANIDWNSHLEYGTGAVQEKVAIIEAVVVDIIDMPFMDMGPSLMREIIDNSSVTYSEEEIDQINDCLAELGKTHHKLNRIYRIWKSGDHSEERYPIPYFVNWALERNINIEWLDWAKLNNLVRDEVGALKVQTFMDTKHHFFANELKIAVEAWTALYEENPPQGTPTGGHKKYIKSWLRKHHSALGANAVDRISTLINPNHRGGASPTIYEN